MTETAIDAEKLGTPPLVSVCIPVYNCEAFIEAAIRSVLAQTFQDFEIVVVDNASPDRTVEVVSGIKDCRIRLIRNETNLGPCKNWNISMEQARGKYIKMVGADDILYKDCLAEKVAILEGDRENKIAMVCTRRDIIDAAGQVMLRDRGWPAQSSALRLSGREAIRKMARAGRNLLGEPVCVFFRRSDALDLGGFNPEIYRTLPFCLDWDLWCRLLQRGDLAVCGNTLCAFRVNAGSESLTLVKKFADNDRLFIESLKQREMADISRLDLLTGAMGAWRDSLLRRGFYTYLKLRRMLPSAG